MEKLITIINPIGTTSLKGTLRKKQKRSNAMAYGVKRKKRVGRPRKRRTVARKRRRRNPTRHRPVVYSVGRGKRKRLRRSPHYRLKPRRVNRRKYRRNPRARFRIPRPREVFTRERMMRGIALVAGLGIGGVTKGFIANLLPAGQGTEMFKRFAGAGVMMVGAMVNFGSRQQVMKNIGTGMVVFGIYDLIVSNLPAEIIRFFPTISPPTAFGNNMSYGRSVYGAQLPQAGGPVEIVGANISSVIAPEVVGEMDLADALEMTA